MMEVKWAYTLWQHKSETKFEGGRVLSPMPVLTLNAVERWLEGERLTLSQCANSQQAIGRSAMIDDLVAQVQAAKEEHGQKG